MALDAHPTRFRVAICGGGISGLCLAVALSKFADIDVQVYEAAQRFKEIGAGVMIWSRTWRILELMGLADDFSKIAHAPPDGSPGVGFDYRKSDQPEEGYRFHLVEFPYGCIRFHRAQFLDAFVNHLPEGIAHFGRRLLSYTSHEDGQSIEMTFADGSLEYCDVLIGCDGIKSMVRKQMLERKDADGLPGLRRFVEPVWSGITAYRGLISSSAFSKDSNGHLHSATQRPMMYCGHSKHVVAYSIAQGDLVNVITFHTELEKERSPFKGEWVTQCSCKELLDCYDKWEPEVVDLLQNIENPTKWALHYIDPLPFYVDGCVALVGDAAHGMLPHQGAGAGQAIEDAFLLAQVLGYEGVTKESLPEALRAYESVRLPIANEVLRGSRDSGMMYEFNSEFGQDFEQLGPAIQKQWDWIWESSPEEDVQKAIDRLADGARSPLL
ncbi:FAD/NAD-binding domain-containing protein [Schizopora paradoxa]|uniref:FAD/NAD-binding domain-containing protein n=1 Tax=Schizopora paradoxa TaxID=27342 RepID=A0A0H2RYQ6_9AGAM|nr:FAD/NAD-binding domain-containing protein [Schizopora paradoxa]